MKKPKRGGRRPGAGRKPPDPALVARVLELAAEGLTARQVAEHPDVKGQRSLRAVYLDIERAAVVARSKDAPYREQMQDGTDGRQG